MTSNDYREPVFMGLTRGATLMGVPYNAFIIVLIGCAVIFLWTQNLLVPFAFWAVGYTTVKVICAKDEKAIDIYLSRLELLKACHIENVRYWKTRSYAPE